MKKYGKWILIALGIMAIIGIVFVMPLWQKIAEKNDVPLISKKVEQTVAPTAKPDVEKEDSEKKEKNQNGNIKVTLSENALNKDVLTYEYQNVNQIYNVKNSKETKAQLDNLKKKTNYTFDKPLLALNPFGTNNNSLYIYFETNSKTYAGYKVSVEDKSVPDFARKLYDDKGGTKEHEYQLLGLIPGKTNKVTINLYDQNDKIIKTKTYSIVLKESKSPAKLKLEMKKGDSKEKLSDGLFFVFGDDEEDETRTHNTLIYDNNGILRGEIPIKSYRSDKMQIINNELIYSYGYSSLAKVSKIGQVKKTYNLKNHRQHHDFVYDGKDKLIMLANGKNKDTSEDLIISLDLKTGKTEEIIDFKKILPEFNKMAKKPADKKKLDWIHLTSIQLVDNKDLILSSRELSSIIRINDYKERPTIKYIIADDIVWKDSKYSKLLYKKDGDFVSHAGQHTVNYISDKNLKKGQYYLELMNNNYGYSSTNNKIDWTKIESVGTDKKSASKSMYYKYLVDENNKTYKLIESIDLPYTAIVGSAITYNDRKIVSLGRVKTFAEYDKSGKLVNEYKLNIKSYMYKVDKYSMNEIWFR